MGDALIGRLVLTIGVRRPSGAIGGGAPLQGHRPCESRRNKSPEAEPKAPEKGGLATRRRKR